MPQKLWKMNGPDDQAKFNDVVDTLCRKYGYQPQIPNPNLEVGGMIDNPETKIVFLRRIEKERVKSEYVEQKKKEVKDSAVIDDSIITENGA